MLTKILQRLREPSFSTTSMADMLFTLTTDKDSEDFLIETAGLRSVEGLSLEKARTEIVFLNLSAIYVALFRYRDVLGWHVEKLDSMYVQYLTHIKAIRQELGAEREEELLQALEARVTTYNKIHDLWREAQEKAVATSKLLQSVRLSLASATRPTSTPSPFLPCNIISSPFSEQSSKLSMNTG